MSSTGSAERASRGVTLAAALLIVLAGCNGAGEDEPPLRIAAVESAGPLVAEAEAAGLTARDAAGRVVPGLAQSWRVADDGLAIVFRLRDAAFTNGAPVTAADVVATLDRARRDTALRDLLAGVTAVAAPLPDVVEIRLAVPQPELLELLATADLGIRLRGRGAIRAGAFLRQAAEEAPAGGTTLGRHDDFYAADQVALAAARFQPVRADEAVRRFARGEFDLVTGGFHRGIGSARALNRPDRLQLVAPPAALLLLVNQSPGPLADLRVRSALAMAIDRDALGPSLFGSAAAAGLPGVVPAGLSAPGALPDWAVRPLPDRQTDARRLLAEAGHGPEGARLRLVVAATDDPADERLLAAVAGSFAAVGVDLAIARRPAADHEAAVAAGRFELALALRTTPYRSPLPFLLPLRCGRNRHGVCLPEADRLLASAWETADPAERAVRLLAAERLWAEDGAAIGLVQPIAWSLVGAGVGGFVANASGVHPLRHLSINQTRRRFS